MSLDDVIRVAVLDALRKAGGNKSEAARVLKIDRGTLARYLKRWGADMFPGGEP